MTRQTQSGQTRPNRVAVGVDAKPNRGGGAGSGGASTNGCCTTFKEYFIKASLLTYFILRLSLIIKIDILRFIFIVILS